MNWIQKRQASLSCIAALFGIAVLALGASWINSFVYEALGEAQPVRILTTLLLIASLVWLADITVDEEGSQSRSIAWFLLSLLLVLGLLGCLTWGYFDWKNRMIPTRADWRSAILFGVIGAIFIFRAFIGQRRSAIVQTIREEERDDSGNPQAHDTPQGEDIFYERWGEVASLIIMLLALFAFGLRYDGTNKLSMQWAEVPAILVVFVLAELGVQLVVNSRRIGRSVRNSARLAERAVSQRHRTI